MDSTAGIKTQLASFIILRTLNKKKQSLEEHNNKENINMIDIKIEVNKDHNIKINKKIGMKK